MARDAFEQKEAGGYGGSRLVGVAAVVDARAVHYEEDLAMVEAIDEAGVGWAIGRNTIWRGKWISGARFASSGVKMVAG